VISQSVGEGEGGCQHAYSPSFPISVRLMLPISSSDGEQDARRLSGGGEVNIIKTH